ncbi:hypothetical protein [uncultured Sulfitobacter sp.]|uniref:hypothetical protein n=1 Tax=uncultured Sulfitobacter sp. TaxID=191468 RepID=UPI00260DB04B|nr:hypothetical protein [uncultured Sulfitobacter sp.]
MTQEAKRLGWVVCANISDHLRSGREKGRFYQGTRKFSAGTKVYLGVPFWGMGGINLRVAGLHRMSRSWTTSIISSSVLVNIRPYGIYSPRKWETITDNYATPFDAKEDALHFMEYIIDASYRERPEKIQPVTVERPWGYFQTAPYRPAPSAPSRGDIGLITRSAQYANKVHMGHTLWLGTHHSYISYLKQTTDIVKKIDPDPSVFSAAWLHGTLTRTGTGYRELETRFGMRAAGLVRELTYPEQSDGKPPMQAQFNCASLKTNAASLIDAATLIVTTREMRTDPPNWPREGTQAYLNNATKIIKKLGVGSTLRLMFEEEKLATGRFWKTLPPPLPD